MVSASNQIINSREDLDLIQGTDQYDQFIEMLKGTIYRLEKDDVNKTWVVVKDLSVIKSFGFTLKDFPDTKAPELPEYTPPPSKVPKIVTMRQARLSLLHANLLQDATNAINAMPGVEGDAARIEWEYAQEVHRDSALVASLAKALKLSDDQLDALFTEAATL